MTSAGRRATTLCLIALAPIASLFGMFGGLGAMFAIPFLLVAVLLSLRR